MDRISTLSSVRWTENLCNTFPSSVFPENLSDASDEQGERLHQGLANIERQYQELCDEVIISDYCSTVEL